LNYKYWGAGTVQPVQSWITGWKARFLFPARARNFSLFHYVQIGFGAYPTSYPMGTGAISPGVKRPRHEADKSPPSNAGVKNGGAIPQFLIRLHGVVLNYFKHRDKYTVYIKR
jgi:hypothetical protein